jgi:hypothetical protein
VPLSHQLPWNELDAPFIIGDPEAATGLPLDRYLPPYFPGRAVNWVNTFAPPGSMILDPFGQDPFSVLELARAGYRVLVTSNNPIPAFILEILASAPSAAELGDALLALANIRMPDGKRLEDYIASFYRLPCPNPDCQDLAEITRFIWNEEHEQPVSAFVRCLRCGFDEEIELTPEHFSQLPALPSYTAHKVRALELSSGLNDPLRPVMEEVIKFYSQRALVLLQLTLSRVNNADLPDRLRNLIKALLLTSADQVNQLWAYPLGRNRPRQLIRPPIYQEINLWEAILRSKDQWNQPGEAVVFRNWPDMPPQKGGISLFAGRLRELSPRPDPRNINLVYTCLPRRNQAYWNLSGLWAGWFWGSNAVEPLRHSLARQRYDWTWHAKALEKVISQLGNYCQAHTPVLLQIGEADPKFLIAAILAAGKSDLVLRSYALDGEDVALQTVWSLQSRAPLSQHELSLQSATRDAAREFLNKSGEPVSFLSLFSNILFRLNERGLLREQPESQPNGSINELEDKLGDVLRDPATFVRYNPGQSIDTGLFWLTNPAPTCEPIIDRAEQCVLDQLQHYEVVEERQILRAVVKELRGLLTPDCETVHAILESYADLQEGECLQWKLRPGDSISQRKADLTEMQSLVEKIANQLKFTRQITPEGIFWKDDYGQPNYSFFITSTAVVMPYLLKYNHQPGLKMIVIPGSRSNLLAYKLKRDPNLEQLVSSNWHFVKFRQLRNIYENPLLSRELFASHITGDPPEFRSSQLALF